MSFSFVSIEVFFFLISGLLNQIELNIFLKYFNWFNFFLRFGFFLNFLDLNLNHVFSINKYTPKQSLGVKKILTNDQTHLSPLRASKIIRFSYIWLIHNVESCSAEVRGWGYSMFDIVVVIVF
jgi:hypothetical protein